MQPGAATSSRELCFGVRACECACFCCAAARRGLVTPAGWAQGWQATGWQAGRVARYGCRCRVRCPVAARAAGVGCAGRVRLGRVASVRRSVLALAIAVVIWPGAALACCRPRPPCGCTAVSPVLSHQPVSWSLRKSRAQKSRSASGAAGGDDAARLVARWRAAAARRWTTACRPRVTIGCGAETGRCLLRHAPVTVVT